MFEKNNICILHIDNSLFLPHYSFHLVSEGNSIYFDSSLFTFSFAHLINCEVLLSQRLRIPQVVAANRVRICGSWSPLCERTSASVDYMYVQTRFVLATMLPSARPARLGLEPVGLSTVVAIRCFDE